MTDSPHQEPRTEGDLRSPSSEDTAPHLLHQFLNLHDEPCPACSYNLRGLTGHTCPECGEELRLRVGLVEPRLAHFIAGLLGLAIGFGFFIVFMALILASALFGSMGAPPPMDEFWPVPVNTLFLGAAMWWWLKHRIWIRRRPAPQRHALLIAAWILPVAATVFFFAWVD